MPDTRVHTPEMSGQPGNASDAINLESGIRSLGAESVHVHRLQQAWRQGLQPLEGSTKEEVKGHSLQTRERWVRKSGADVQKSLQLLTFLPHTRQETQVELQRREEELGEGAP